MLLAFALLLAPLFIGAAIGLSQQQAQISDAREDSRELAVRLGRLAQLQADLDSTEDAVLRHPGEGAGAAAGPRVRGTLARANADVLVLDNRALERDFGHLEALAAGPLATPASRRRLEAPLDALRLTTGELAQKTVDHATAAELRGDARQRTQLLATLAAFAATLLITLLIARWFLGTLQRPLRVLRASARKLGSGDLAHRAELDSFTEFNQVAESFNLMADALRKTGHELSQHALRDSLTGLANRALLFDRIGHALARRERGERIAIGVLFINLDDFKGVNDSLGHTRGDEVLVEVGRRVRDVLRPSDTIARLGGDEFGVLLEDLAGRKSAAGVAERILLSLSSPVVIGDAEVELNASIGVAVSGEELDGAEELVRAADLAMYAAKAGGKGRYRSFVPAMLSGTVERLTLEQDLKQAIAREELELYYQPVVDLDTGRVRGVEALARWTHAERGPIVPDVFIPLAEQSGLIMPLGRWVMARACADLPALRRAFDEPAMVISVNLSASELLEPGLPDHVVNCIEAARIAPGSLILEITETQIMSDVDAAIARLHDLKTLGVTLALDDFGTGFSSLAYLRSFPVDALKIDRAFIDNVADPASDDHALVRAIISLGQTLSLTVVAEGIETEDQRRELKRLDCDRGQGYLFSRPLPLGELALSYGRGPALRYS